jgi:hypothetical protein
MRIYGQTFSSAGYNVMYPLISQVHEVQITIQVRRFRLFLYEIRDLYSVTAVNSEPVTSKYILRTISQSYRSKVTVHPLQTDEVRDIPCGTRGGAMIMFDKVRPAPPTPRRQIRAPLSTNPRATSAPGLNPSPASLQQACHPWDEGNIFSSKNATADAAHNPRGDLDILGASDSPPRCCESFGAPLRRAHRPQRLRHRRAVLGDRLAPARPIPGAPPPIPPSPAATGIACCLPSPRPDAAPGIVSSCCLPSRRPA